MKVMMIMMEKETKRKNKINKTKESSLFSTSPRHHGAKSLLMNRTSKDSYKMKC